MKDSTVRNKIILSFSTVVLLIVGLCGFAYVQLRAIESEVTVARLESVPGLGLAARMEAVSISTFTTVQQLAGEDDESKARTLRDYLAAKTAERLELVGQYKRLIRTDEQRQLLAATETALAEAAPKQMVTIMVCCPMNRTFDAELRAKSSLRQLINA